MKKIYLAIFICLLIPAIAACTNSDVSNTKVTEVISADYPYYETQEDLYDAATSIVNGKILSVESKNIDVTGDKGELLPYLVYKVEIESVFKGKREQGEEIEVKVFGGETEEKVVRMKDAPEFNIGQNYYLFLADYYNEIPSSLLNMVQTVFTEEDMNGQKLSNPYIEVDLNYLDEQRNKEIKNLSEH